MKSIYILLIGFFIGMSVQAQDTLTLYQQWQKQPHDPIKLKLALQLAEQCQGLAPKRTRHYAQLAYLIAQRIQDPISMGNALIFKGNAAIIQGNYPEALTCMESAKDQFEGVVDRLSGAEKKEAMLGSARAWGSMGIIFSEQSNYARALGFHLKSLHIYQQLKNNEKSARVSNNIGVVYLSLNSPAKALPYFVQALEDLKNSSDPSQPSMCTNIGKAYAHMNQYQQAARYYGLAVQLFTKFPDARGLGELFNNQALLALQQKQPFEALKRAQSALQQFASIDDKFGQADTDLIMANCYAFNKNWDQAIQKAQHSLQLARTLGVWEQQKLAEEKLAEWFELKGDLDNAMLHYKAFNVAKDSLNNQENMRLGIQTELNEAFEKREAVTKKEQEKQQIRWQEQDKQHQQLFIFVVVALLLSIGLVFVLFNRHQLKKTLTLQKELAEYEQKALHLQMNPHFVFNCLGSISSFIVQNGTDSAIKYLAKFSKLMRLTLEYSKEAIIPISKELESLQNYLELEQLRFHRKFDFEIVVASEVEDDMGIPPLMIQPLVENAIVHGVIPKGGQGLILLKFSVEGPLLICEITDNGVGLHFSQQQKKQSMAAHKSMALDILRKRLEMITAKTGIAAHLEASEMTENGHVLGTRIVLQLPIQ
ncbi:MAG: hypothetical protein CFE24_04370 [Flavobacterium sp. BFFFF2]|nr:MAG: hypothetical protein CFE24_04370 [Flavobacterium sp. BFFFF2]